MEIELKQAVDKVIGLTNEIRETKADASALKELEVKLAGAIEAKTALEARVSAMEAAATLPGLAGKGDADALEVKSAWDGLLRNPTDYARKSAYEDICKKSVNVTTGANGAFAVPAQMAADIVSIAKDFSPMRSLSRVVQVGTSDYKEILSLGGAGFEWVGDTTTRNVTAEPTIREVRPTMGEIAARAQITNQALEDIFYDAASWLTTELAETFAQAEGAAFISGDGTNKPTGLLNGTTLTKINSGAAATLGTDPFGKLIDLAFSVKAGYRANGTFLMNSATLASLIKVKDSTGNFIYQPSLAAGVASTLLGYRVAIDENMPAVGANATPIIFGDFSRGYLIADRVHMHMLINPFKISGLVEYEARKRVAGIIKDTTALKGLLVAA